jgi:hypothetical protein
MADGPVKSHRLVGQCGDGRRYVDPRSEAGVSSRNRHSPELLPKGTSRRELAPRPRPLGRRSWQNYPVCSAREQLPADGENLLGRRTAGAREPVATQVASRVSGAHGPWLRRMGANRVSQGLGPGTWAGSSACAAGKRVRGSRDCGPVASLNSSCQKKTGDRCCYKSGLWIELRRAIDLPRASIAPQRFPTVRRGNQLGNGEG